jgi:hypothetical protein
MKKIIASAGMFVAGVAGLNAENLGDLSPELASRRWHVSAALRGFYDDNYATRPSGPEKRGSGGIEFSPQASVNLPMEQTYLSAAYTLSLRYYFDRPGDEIDQSHTLDLKLDHRFSERHRLKAQDTFVYSQEPAIIDRGGTVNVPLRNNVEVIHNLLPIEFEWQLSRLFALSLGYQNTYYNFLDSGDGSYSALLDRWEHLFRVDGRYQLTEHSTVLLGYQFGIVSYTSDDLLAPPPSLKASARDNRSHYLYVGYEQEFANHLSLSARAGGVYTEYTELNDTDLSPYVDVAVSYQYLPGDNLRIGLKQSHNPTDQAGGAANERTLVKDQDTTTVYGSVTHRLTPKLTANGSVQYQHSVYNGGTLDGEADDYVQLAFILAYKLTRNWSAELEYDFYTLLSDVPGREFTRNVVYGGVRFIF